ncbi:hypothetical protein CLOP_g12454 [Closterium sp. NIES-67]|nr:hypothetical protein CLOP_g12454 [Closterium sp. NIES-67]
MVRPMRHPLRDLPSLLVRLGVILQPLEGGSFSWEWKEWPEGNEAAMKLPDDPSTRCFLMGVVEARRAAGRPSRGRGGRTRCRGGVSSALPERVAAGHRGLPMVQCTADVDFLQHALSHTVAPLACAHCKACFAAFTAAVPLIALVAALAFRPAHALVQRVAAVIAPHSSAFNDLAQMFFLLCLPPTCLAPWLWRSWRSRQTRCRCRCY